MLRISLSVTLPTWVSELLTPAASARFAGHGLEALNSERSRVIETTRTDVLPGNLFSDLNQWLLKILFSRNIPDSLLSAARGPFENASQLAEAASVSVMSAFRLLRQLSEDGFLEEQGGLRLVRTEELLERWLRASRKEPFSCCTSVPCKPHGSQSFGL